MDNFKTVQQVQPTQLLHPYVASTSQELQTTNYLPQITHCDQFLRQCICNPAFPPLISSLIKQDFSRVGIISFHNQHLWEYKKQWILHSIQQEQFSLNGWDCLWEPYFLPAHLTIFPTEHPSRATARKWNFRPELIYSLCAKVLNSIFFLQFVHSWMCFHNDGQDRAD